MKQAMSLGKKDKQILFSYSKNRTFRFILFLLFGFLFSAMSTNLHAQDTRISINARNTTVREILKMIEAKSDYHFAYNNKLIDVTRKVDVTTNNEKISDILKRIFANTDVTITVLDHQIVLASAKAMGNPVVNPILEKISGKVTDENGQALPGVTIVIKGTTTGTITDANGNYSFLNVYPNETLDYSFVGMQSKEVRVGNQNVLNITLTEGATNLNEIVVVGYGTQKRIDLTGSVGSVKGNQFANQPITNPVAALQGRIAGINVVESSGAPDATPTITIRGLSSLNQPNPLYIVDGVRVMDGNNINVQDIATIDVLRDASAASIYGAAAAGGVILITTKQGQSGPPQVSFNYRYGISAPKLVSLLDKDDFIKLENIINPSYFENADGTPKSGISSLSNTNWVKALYSNGVEQNYNLSISGSKSEINYLFSGFYNRQSGVYMDNYSNIGGARINSDSQLNKWLKVGEQIDVSQRTTAPTGVGANTDLHNAPFRTLPIISVKDTTSFGAVPKGYGNLSQFGGVNPVAAIDNANIQNVINNLQSNVFAEVSLPFGFSFRTNFSYDYNSENQLYYQNAYTNGVIAVTTNSLQKYFTETTQFLTNEVLTWKHNFGKHNFDAMAGYEQINNDYNNLQATETSIGMPGYSFVQTSNSSLAISGKYDTNGLIKSEFARLNYNFDRRYYLSGSIRQDANFQVFGPNKQKGVFPSVSAGWNINEERFFKPLTSIIDLLKLYGSYGTLGNSNIAPYSFNSSYSQFASSSGGATGAQNFAPGGPLLIATSTNGIANPNLHWETVKETNIGIDGQAFNGRLYFTAEWYNKNTVNMLYNVTLPLSTGFTQPFLDNIGSVNNKGVDLSLGYRSKISDFGYDVNVTGSFNQNKVTNLSGLATDAIYDGYNYFNNGDNQYNMWSNQQLTVTKVGLPFGSFYGYKVTGMFKTDAQAAASSQPSAHAGDLIFQDYNHDGQINSNDKQVIGNPNPKLVYGINIHLNYKEFDVALLFNGVAGVQLFNGVKAYEQYPFSDGNTTSQIFNDSFFGSNGLTSQPRLGIKNANGSFTLDPNGNYTQANSYFVENGSYLKLKNLQIGYTFSDKVLQKLRIHSIRVFAMANNLFVITKYSGLDPELGSSASNLGYSGITTRGIDVVTQYPQTRIFSMGLDVKF
jgi:TonB-linked SusC/RagA family outer membrane protein